MPAQQIEEHQHVSLLEHLVLVGLLDAKDGLHGCAPRLIVCQIDVLEAKEAFELLDQTTVWIEQNEHVVTDMPPRSPAFRRQV